MGPRACRILQIYWGRMRMVANVGGYFGSPFQGFRVVTQGVPLSPTILNVVVGAVVRHWVKRIVESADEYSGRGQEGRHQNSLFYADDVMVASSDPRWLLGEFSTLVGLFDRVGLNANVGKTFGMVYRSCQVVGTQLEAGYKRWMTGAGPS